MPEINSVLKDRGSKYGPFDTHAEITQRLKNIVQSYDGWDRLTWSQKECIDMIFHKLGRIINGNPNHPDSWVDLVGYPQLVVNQLEAEELEDGH